MHLRSYRYSEFSGEPQSWDVERFNLDAINLVVGQNASGKTRLLNTIGSVASFLSASAPMSWNSGLWEFTISDGVDTADIVLEVAQKKVVREKLTLNGEVKIHRHQDGKGKIWFEQIGQTLDFEMPDNLVAMVARRDSLQHPFLEALHNWANRVRHFHFSTDLGRGTIYLLTPPDEASSTDVDGDPRAVSDPNGAVEQYNTAYGKIGPDYDRAILDDLRAIGYDCDGIDAIPAEGFPYINGRLPVMLQVQERGLATPTRQLQMSTGMFRALAIIIHINYALMLELDGTILIDDIGEGLDYHRSKSLINRLIEKCAGTSVQLVMTSNDRFVMNEVDLKYWHVLHRTSQSIEVLDNNNSRQEFENFSYLGMSNFDFFSSKAFLGSSIH